MFQPRLVQSFPKSLAKTEHRHQAKLCGTGEEVQKDWMWKTLHQVFEKDKFIIMILRMGNIYMIFQLVLLIIQQKD